MLIFEEWERQEKEASKPYKEEVDEYHEHRSMNTAQLIGWPIKKRELAPQRVEMRKMMLVVGSLCKPLTMILKKKWPGN